MFVGRAKPATQVSIKQAPSLVNQFPRIKILKPSIESDVFFDR